MDLLIAFVAAWLIKGAWEDKAADHHASQRDIRKQINRAHPNWSKDRRERAIRNAKRRHTLGWIAYQFRHGWIPTFHDIADGYRAARIGHAEWDKDRPPEGSGWWQRWKTSWKAGWAGAKKRAAAKAKAAAGAMKPAAKDDQAADGPAKPEPPRPPDGGQPNPAPQAAQAANAAATASSPPQVPHLRPVPATPQRNGGTMEAHNIEAAKSAVAAAGNGASVLAGNLEQTVADMLAGGMGADSETMAHLSSMQEALANALAYGNAAVASMNKHQSGQEYADTGHAAKTEFLKTS